jgi:hypothetical protein
MMKYQKNIAMKKILAADYKDIPRYYSKDIRNLLQNTINIDKNKRWTAPQILEKIKEKLN